VQPSSAGAARSQLRRWAGAAGRWAGKRWLVLALGLTAALPILVAMGCAVAQHWTPVGDNAYVATRAYDVFTSRTPLVGQRSSGASTVVDNTAYSPGPLLFWLMAIPARLPDGIFLMLTMGAVNVAMVMGTVGLALRRGARVLMFATAAAIPVMLASLPAAVYSDIWNPSAPLMPLMLLIFLAWSLACGEYRLLPLAVVVASFAAQTHLAFVGPVVAVMAAAVACGLLLGTLRRWPRRWMVGSLMVLLVCWSAPLLDQATNRPGNLVVLKRSALAEEPSLGFNAAWRAVVHMVGVPPWWLQEDRNALVRANDLAARPGAFQIATAGLVLMALAVCTVAGWRRRRADLCAAGVIGLALCAAVATSAASNPVKSLFNVGYLLRWASPAGMSVWLVLGWSLAMLIGMRWEAPAQWAARWRAPVTAGLVALSTIVATAVAVAENPPQDEPYKPMRAILGQLDAHLPESGGTRVEASSEASYVLTTTFEAGIVYGLRRGSRSVVTAPRVAERLDEEYGHGSYVRVVTVTVDLPPPEGARTLLELTVPELGTSRRVTVSVRSESGRS
jgi:hypothetical protein